MNHRPLRTIARGVAASVAIAAVSPAWAGPIQIETPMKGEAVGGSNIACVAQFESRNQPITRVVFLVDGEALVQKTYKDPATQARAAFVWDAKGVPAGPHTLTVRAYAGNQLVGEDEVPVVVADDGIDIVKPQVHLFSPRPNSVVSGKQDIAIHASDNDRVTMVSLFVNRQLKLLQNVPPFYYSWDTTQYPNGPHTIEVWAFDPAQNKGESKPIRVFINNPTGRTDVKDLPDEAPVEAPTKAVSKTAAPKAVQPGSLPAAAPAPEKPKATAAPAKPAPALKPAPQVAKTAPVKPAPPKAAPVKAVPVKPAAVKPLPAPVVTKVTAPPVAPVAKAAAPETVKAPAALQSVKAPETPAKAASPETPPETVKAPATPTKAAPVAPVAAAKPATPAPVAAKPAPPMPVAKAAVPNVPLKPVPTKVTLAIPEAPVTPKAAAPKPEVQAPTAAAPVKAPVATAKPAPKPTVPSVQPLVETTKIAAAKPEPTKASPKPVRIAQAPKPTVVEKAAIAPAPTPAGPMNAQPEVAKAETPTFIAPKPAETPMGVVNPQLRASLPVVTSQRNGASSAEPKPASVAPKVATAPKPSAVPPKANVAVPPKTAVAPKAKTAPVRVARAETRSATPLGQARSDEMAPQRVSPAAHRIAAARPPLRIMLGEEPIEFDVQPVIKEGFAIAPFRQIIEHTGGMVMWLPATRTVQATSGTQNIEIQIGSRRAKVNAQIVIMDRPASLTQGRTMVPVRFLQSALNMKAVYDPSKGLVYLYRK